MKTYALTVSGKSKLETREENLKRQIMHIVFLQTTTTVETIARILNQKKKLIQKLVDELVQEKILE